MSRKTAEELGITQEEFDDLVWVRDALDPSKVEVELPRWLEFDMRNWAWRGEDDGLASCGTQACLGGTMHLRRAARLVDKSMGDVTYADTRENDYDPSRALEKLFFVWDHNQPRSVELAIRAVDNFLAGSKDPWNRP